MKIKQKYAAVKVHLQENKQVYLAAAGGLALGALTTMAFTKRDAIVINDSYKFQWKSPTTNKIEVYIEALGDPGNIVQDSTTGIVYASQGQFAREIGVSPSLVSKHLAGIIPDVKGHKLEKLGKAMVSQ